MQKFFLMCGLPGSGKSTKAKQIADDTGACIVSPDALRLMFNAGRYPSGQRYAEIDPVVWAVTRQAITELLRSGQSVILDATNLTESGRQGWIALARDIVPAIETEIVYCASDYDSPERWQQERGIPPNEYRRIRKKLEARFEVPG